MKISIIGKGTAGTLTAITLSQKFKDAEIEWIYPENNKTIGVGEGLAPPSSLFLDSIGITTEAVLRKYGGTIKLGISYIDWLKDTNFYVPAANNYILEYYMKKNRYPLAITKSDQITHHFNAEILNSIEVNNIKIKNEFVNNLNDIDSDFIIDCRGFSDSEDWVDFGKLRNNTALVARVPTTADNLEGFTTFYAMDYGWIWTIPLQDFISLGFVTNSEFIDEAKNEFKQHIKQKYNKEFEDFPLIPFKVGYRKNQIYDLDNRKVFNVGLNAAFIEPLQASGISLIAVQIQELVRILEIGDRGWNSQFERIFSKVYQFILNHFILCEKSSKYWDYYKQFEFKDFIFSEKDPDIFDRHYERRIYQNFLRRKVIYDQNNFGEHTITNLKSLNDILMNFKSDGK